MAYDLYLVKGYWRHFKENQCIPWRDKRLDNLLRLKVFCTKREHIHKCDFMTINHFQTTSFHLDNTRILRVSTCTLQIPKYHPLPTVSFIVASSARWHLFFIIPSIHYWWGLKVSQSQPLGSVIKIKNPQLPVKGMGPGRFRATGSFTGLLSLVCIQKPGLTTPHLTSTLIYLWSNDYLKYNLERWLSGLAFLLQ